MIVFYKYTGAGNDFLIADNREGSIELSAEQIQKYCDRRYGVGADGVMLLENEQGYDFKMVYYNSDGSGGMMCGNGGRCIVAFAHDLGIVPCSAGQYHFLAADGPHDATVNGSTVRLKMKDVTEVTPTEDGLFLDTGTRHLVVKVDDIKSHDVFNEGRALRYKPLYGPIGTNVNFTQMIDGVLHVRTYEKGVEDETFACGTGIVASAIANSCEGLAGPVSSSPCHPVTPSSIKIKALRDDLAVEFVANKNGSFTNVWLIGPAQYIARVEIP